MGGGRQGGEGWQGRGGVTQSLGLDGGWSTLIEHSVGLQDYVNKVGGGEEESGAYVSLGERSDL